MLNLAVYPEADLTILRGIHSARPLIRNPLLSSTLVYVPCSYVLRVYLL
jgi:hypothetical protein